MTPETHVHRGRAVALLPNVLAVNRAVRHFEAALPGLAQAVEKAAEPAPERFRLYHLAAASALRSCGVTADWSEIAGTVRSRWLPGGAVAVPRVVRIEGLPPDKDRFVALVQDEVIRAFRPVPPALVAEYTDGVVPLACVVWRFTLKAFAEFFGRMGARSARKA